MLSRPCVCEEVDWRPALVSLVMLLRRRHGRSLQGTSKKHLGPPWRRLKPSHVHGAEPQPLILGESDLDVVAVGPVADQRAYDPTTIVFEPTELLAGDARHRCTSVPGQSIEAHERDWSHRL